jgi:hypothetical protein
VKARPSLLPVLAAVVLLCTTVLLIGCSASKRGAPTTTGLVASITAVSSPGRATPSYAPMPTHTAVAVADSVLREFLSGMVWDWPSRASLAPMPCAPDSSAAPPCAGAPAGSPVPAFYAAGCEPPFLTDAQAAQDVIRHKLEGAAAWEVYGVVRGGIPGLTPDGYVVELRIATGNGGNLWYLSPGGRIVGIRNGCGAGLGTAGRLIPNPTYLYGPCWFGVCGTPTPPG